MVPLARIERATSPLPRECSTTELQRRKPLRRRFSRDQRAGAGEGNRTLVVSLEGFCSTIELHPRFTTEPFLPPSAYCQPAPQKTWWRRLDSNQRRRKANRFTVCPL